MGFGETSWPRSPVTGGGFYGNIPRVFPEGSSGRIKKGSWPVQPIFRQIQQRSQIDEKEMFRPFNMGVGTVAILGSRNSHRAVKLLEKMSQQAWIIGEVIEEG